MNLPRSVQEKFRRFGKAGGQTRAARLSPTARRAIAQKAALRRWIRVRFGETSFEVLELPGGDLVDQGLDDLAAGKETAVSLLVSLAAPRLRREKVPIPAALPADPDSKLYRLLSATEGDLAHARYLAHLEQIASFADACGTLQTKLSRRAR